ncbi:glycosyltransferase [Mucilaginibacter sp.]|uniref:glycosyltransferase n=1 Tax=Mucilaginibacter sp. TaxID=1882438 RepID=UPI00284A99F2|nr:glycosyltransferase [Mucilaginibacter sp.]MDR3696325.1 glycosyltransferase [Mucilaginibacter sp.]
MKIAIWATAIKNRHTGGRVFPWLLAYAFAYNNFDVDIFTNTMPLFAKNFNDYPSGERVKIHVNKLFLFFPFKKYDLLVIGPHLASRKSFIYDRFFFYPMAKLFKRISGCEMWYIDHESPNWINEVLPGVRPYSKYKYSNKIIPKTDAILSATKTGADYAARYYTDFNPGIKFIQVYHPINSIVADKIKIFNKEDKIIYFGRFSEKHKNPEIIVNIIKSLPKGYKLLIIGSKEQISQDLYEKMFFESKKNEIIIEFKQGITDLEKYEELASSKLLLYTSTFEGYGLPPIEAQYVGTPVICSDLPVLREVNKNAIFVDFENQSALKVVIEKALHTNYTLEQLKSSVEPFAKFENFASNLGNAAKAYFKS